MSTSSMQMPQFEKLTGADNFPMWRLQMSAYLEVHDLMQVADGTCKIEPGAAGADQAAVARFKTKDAAAKLAILSAVDANQREYVSAARSAADMWGNLCRVYDRKNPTSRTNALKVYHRYSYDGRSMAQHIAHVDNLAQACVDAGEEISDENYYAKLLDDLPERYTPVVIAWDVVATQSRDALRRMLLQGEARMANAESSDQALAVKSKTQRAVVDPAKTPGKSKKGKKAVTCYRCQRVGHYARECQSGDKKLDSNGKKQDGGGKKQDGDGEKPAAGGSDNCFTVGSRVAVDSDWIADSGATCHMTNDKSWFADMVDCSMTLNVANNSHVEAMGRGTVAVECLVDGRWEPANFLDVLYVPSLSKSLFSVGAAGRQGVTACYNGQKLLFKKNGETKLIADQLPSNLFGLRVRRQHVQEANVAVSVRRWHERLGHVGLSTMRRMVRTGAIPELKIPTDYEFVCESCVYGKHAKKTFNDADLKAFRKGEFISSDVCGPMPVASYGGHRYLVTFKDYATGFRFVFFLKSKDEVFDKFVNVYNRIETMHGTRIKILRSDNGLEYRNSKFRDFCNAKGMHHQFSAPYTPEQNGAAERENRTLVEDGRTMRLAKNLPEELWAESVLCSAYLRNRMPSAKYPDSSPYEQWFGYAPKLEHVRPFGAIAYEKIKGQRTKWQPKSVRRVLVGYESESSNYRLLDMKTKKITVSRDVIFDEDGQPHEDEVVSRWAPRPGAVPMEDDTELQTESSASNEDEVDLQAESSTSYEDAMESHAGSSASDEDKTDKPTDSNRRLGSRQLRDRFKLKEPERYQAHICELIEPTSMAEAERRSDWSKWRDARDLELEAHRKNGTWIESDLPPGRRPISARWVFKYKLDKNGDIIKYKARLVARGYSQREGVDFSETFAPVVRYDSVRVLLALAAINDWDMRQFDVRTAFLYGELDEDIFMTLPEGVPGSGQVVKLVKSLYGLKQSPRQWNKRFKSFLDSYGFVASDADRCVFIGIVDGQLVILGLYVDDGLLLSSSSVALDKVIRVLRLEFEVTLENVDYFVGLEIRRNREKREIRVGQRGYITRVAEKFRLLDARGTSTPAQHGLQLDYSMAPGTEDERQKMLKVPYREAVGMLMFAACVSRPDVMYAVSVVSRYSADPGQAHWTAVKKIICYLRDTAEYNIVYNGSNTEGLKIYSDSDYAADPDTRRSRSGYVATLAGGAVSWSSEMQPVVALSTTEAEYVAACGASKEAIWLRRLLKSVGVRLSSATKMYLDNQGSIKLIRNPEFHKRTKHIAVRFHFIREVHESGEIDIVYVPSSKQLADILTKALPKQSFLLNRKGLQLELEAQKSSTSGSVAYIWFRTERIGSDVAMGAL